MWVHHLRQRSTGIEAVIIRTTPMIQALLNSNNTEPTILKTNVCLKEIIVVGEEVAAEELPLIEVVDWS
jgi:hypothetical protein